MAQKKSKPYKRKRYPPSAVTDRLIKDVEYEELPEKPGWHIRTIVGECSRCHGLVQVENGSVTLHLIPTDETYRTRLGRERPPCAGSGALPHGNIVWYLGNTIMKYVPVKRLWALLGAGGSPVEIDELSRMPLPPIPADPTADEILALLYQTPPPTVGEMLRNREK
jgi:hypothetical protein